MGPIHIEAVLMVLEKSLVQNAQSSTHTVNEVEQFQKLLPALII